MSQHVLSIDIGGSKILTALVSRNGKVLARELEPTAALDRFETVLEQIEAATRHRQRCGHYFAKSSTMAECPAQSADRRQAEPAHIHD